MKHVILSFLLLVSVFSFFSCESTESVAVVETPKTQEKPPIYLYEYSVIPDWDVTYDNYEKKQEDAIKYCEKIRDSYIADGYNAEIYVYDKWASSKTTVIHFDKPDYKLFYVTIKIYPDEPTSKESTEKLIKELEASENYHTRWRVQINRILNPAYKQ